MDRQLPAFVLCLGLPGSASTWVFNITAHLLSTPQVSLISGYIDTGIAKFLDQLNASDKHIDVVVLKSHQADAALFDFISAHASRCVLSVRDPRDCVVSLMERFGFSFEYALAAVVKSCHSLMRFQRLGVPLFRYEDHFFRSPDALSALHDYLNPGQAVDLDKLGQLYSQAAIEHHIDHFDRLPAGRVQKRGADEYDGVAHWHRNHFGDGLVGKWSSRLSPLQIAQATLALGASLEQLGYAADQAADAISRTG